MKKIIILENNGGQLANQLWQYANFYAYAKEKGFSLENYAFFRYQHYFNLLSARNSIIRFLTIKLFSLHKNVRIAKLSQLFLVNLYKLFFKKRIISSKEIFYLEPSLNSNFEQRRLLKEIENQKLVHYFCGWNFRNPVGLTKHRQQIVDYFRPRSGYASQVADFIGSLRKKYSRLVGVHIRQGDYRDWQGGRYYFSCLMVRDILDSFLKKQKDITNIIFIICSDEEIDDRAFRGLNYVKGLNEKILDLYTLAATDLLIGSTSTFGQWAAYYGGIEMINFSQEKDFWEKYSADKPEPNPWLIY